MYALLRQWLSTPFENFRLLSNFTRQDFSAQYASSIVGFLWLFLTPLANIAIYGFVFGYVFQLRALPEFRETEFVLFMMLGYLPWFALAESLGKSTSLLIEKAGLITKVKFPVQILPIVCTLVPYMTHIIGFGLLLSYLALQGYFSALWLWIPAIYFMQFLFTMGLVSIISTLSVFLRDLNQLISLGITIWFFLTPIIYPISLIEDESVRSYFLFNPMHSFVSLYREIVLLGEMSHLNLFIIAPISFCTYVFGGWFFLRIKHAFGDVL